jgi:UPF0042 nucleotide-binding protein
MKRNRLVVISGVSGSGKSTALRAFEDSGYFCVDNLPAQLITHFADLLSDGDSPGGGSTDVLLASGMPQDMQGESSLGYALLVDCRHEKAFPHVWSAVKRLEESGVEVSLLFLECDDEVAVRRYRETRRPHPFLISEGFHSTIAEALSRERMMLAGFREAAERIIDTSSLSPHELRKIITSYCGAQTELEVTILSFGYKHGVPFDIDLLVDVRFLPNPHFVSSLREHTGNDREVYNYVFSSADALDFVQRYVELLDFLIPRYRDEGKRYLTVGVGCTGGKHRSVAIARKLHEELLGREVDVVVRHRDLTRE